MRSFLLVTYDLLTRSELLQAAITSARCGMLIADESHMLKNIDSKRSQIARRFASQVKPSPVRKAAAKQRGR